MILDIITVLFLVLGLTVSSRLFGHRRGDVLYHISNPHRRNDRQNRPAGHRPDTKRAVKRAAAEEAMSVSKFLERTLRKVLANTGYIDKRPPTEAARHAERVFNPGPKDHHWGKRLARSTKATFRPA